MSRKRKSTTQEPPADTSPATTEQPASTKDPDQAAIDHQPGFAEQVGQRKGLTAPDPFAIATDVIAGVRLFESKQEHQVAIKFEDKPSRLVIETLKESGFHWNPTEKIWAQPLWPSSAMGTRIRAEQLFQEVSQMIRQEKGIEPEQGVPF